MSFKKFISNKIIAGAIALFLGILLTYCIFVIIAFLFPGFQPDDTLYPESIIERIYWSLDPLRYPPNEMGIRKERFGIGPSIIFIFVYNNLLFLKKI